MVVRTSVTQTLQGLVAACALASALPQVSSFGTPQLRLTSDGPTVLDAKISFSAILDYADIYSGPFYFRWSDDASPGHWVEEETNNRFMNYSLSYSSKQYEEREYTMTVRVFTEITFFREEIAASNIKFRITKQLNGEIVVHQRKAKGHTVSSKDKVEFKIDLHDPSGFLDGAVMQYFWFINDTNYGPTENSSFYYTFSSPGLSTAEVMVLAKVGGDPEVSALNGFWRNASELVRSATSLSKTKLNPPVPTVPPYVKSGVFRTVIESRTPISVLNATGDTWLKHGKLLQLDILCDGSGPWNFCWSINDAPYNITGNETCFDPQQMAQACEFPIIWYFRNNGTFDIVTVVDNVISKVVQVVHVNIYQVHHQTPLSLVVVPICSCLIAIVAVGSGIFVWLAYKRNLAVETADFDFSSPDEQLEYKTFWDRLRDSMMNAFGNSSDNVSHVSSVSSRSGPPPANIHYGSIT